ncbi:MAG: PepSY domain-containing protein [Aestuariivirgaceae bacterium]|nr:PepSY domain-containing protein [Aestuariivirgaceae bacterium]
MKMKLTAAAALCLALTAGAAFAEVTLTDETAAQIKQTLTAQGYDVGKIKVEDGLFEAYVKKDGKKFEVFLNEKMEIVKSEMD